MARERCWCELAAECRREVGRVLSQQRRTPEKGQAGDLPHLGMLLPSARCGCPAGACSGASEGFAGGFCAPLVALLSWLAHLCPVSCQHCFWAPCSKPACFAQPLPIC